VADLTTKSREQIIADYQRDYLLRCPTALTGPGTQPYQSAVLIADQLQPLYANCVKAARASDYELQSIEELRIEAERLGVVIAGAVGSTGYVTITAATAGTTIFSGDELTEPNTKARFYCLTTALYADGAEVPIASRGTGPAQNLDGATVLQWSAPRAGCATTCVVFTDSNGDGLKGGSDEDDREQIIEKIRDQLANPPGAGNAAEVRNWAKETPAVQIEEVFAFPCAYGPGTCGWCFTVPADSTGSRIPTALQSALVGAQIDASAPHTDLYFYTSMTALATAIVAQVTWDPEAVGWADESPWPGYFATSGAGSGSVQISGATGPLTFTLATSDGDYSTCGDPVTGQALAFWDNTNKVFWKKVILTVAGGGPWVIVCDGTLGASDSTYTPTVGQRAMPWSDSLETLIAPLVAHFDGIGPGEAKATTYLDGSRGRRDPSTPKYWPAQITKSLEAAMEAVSTVESLDLTEGGTAFAAAHLPPYLLTLSQFSVFPA
jgi:hypothetical protein